MTQDLLSNQLKKSNFENFSYYIILQNETSGTSVLDHEIIKINELSRKGISLTVPKNSCKKSHNLSLAFIKTKPATKITRFPSKSTPDIFIITGKIMDLVDQLDEDLDEKDNIVGHGISINFNQFDEYKWKQIIKQYEAPQRSINEMISKGKA